MFNQANNRLFIIDDDQFYASILEATLHTIGDFEIEIYLNGQDCITNAHKQPAIIFLDHDLGDVNGFEVLREIKSTYPQINVVMLSGQTEIKVAVQSLRFGATDYLIKQIDDSVEKLSHIIEDIKHINRIRSKMMVKKKKFLGIL